MRHVAVTITTKNIPEAKKIAGIIVRNKLAACANIIPSVYSVYWWKKKIQEHTEAMIVFKTRNALVKRLIRVVKENHSYAVPEIVVLPITGGSSDYLKWIDESTTG
jgi:periplasmic divalent cation tolerance protein